MKHKVSELEGVLLDAAVARARGIGPGLVAQWLADPPPQGPAGWSPSTRWATGGPIIDGERIATWWSERENRWQAGFELDGGESYGSISMEHWQTGDTALTAAMRAYVCAKFGEEVELP